MKLKDKAILVTGSSQGIGLAVGLAMLREGAQVVFHSEKPMSKCGEVIKAIGTPNAFYVQADLSKEGEARRLVQVASERYGPLDALVNNVGTFREPELLAVAKKDFEAIFSLNVWSALEATQEYVRINQKAGRGGRILFSSSLNGTRSEPGHTLYDASKGALNALTRQLALELAQLGFTTAAVAPGLIETPLTDFGMKSDPAVREAIRKQIPIQRIGTIEDVAEWYVFLASDAAKYATGQVVAVDGGLDAQQMAFRPIAHSER
ncbi:SDR family oxidoreductase [Telmatocola sphagniphila]|uniref:SDR family oxidoreductase n=1 Tax=Telmatocola sphagniphila TaxID=1123043 RepID=A0A8E6B625_9BACT|nr:SDR family oxidoreductase [Telmatocola sphagniphila]QVL32042.1 SDR family oxidoreductase [Telmatocola sphagniphila]